MTLHRFFVKSRNLDIYSVEDIQELTKLYQEAEEILKEIERDTQEGIVVPAVNELRYAGYHLLQALNSGEPGARAIQITKA